MTKVTSQNSTRRILLASLAGTTIEFFDFYIYGTAAVLVFPKLFFPAADQTTAILESLATFALAFFARPVGAALFGHFGDRIGRKATLDCRPDDHGDIDGSYWPSARLSYYWDCSPCSYWHCCGLGKELGLAENGVVPCYSLQKMHRQAKKPGMECFLNLALRSGLYFQPVYFLFSAT